MKILFSIQGEGRGHLTQALAVKQMLTAAGHQIVGVVVGISRHRKLPAFFETDIAMPVIQLPTLEFVYKNNRSVSLPATAASVIQRVPAYARSLRQFKSLVRERQPDVILNFFEPLTGIYALTTRRRPPIVAIGHQFMFEHPDYIRAPGLRVQQLGMKWFVRL